MYLDYAEDQAQRRRTMHMADWVHNLDGFLRFNERNILKHFGKVSHQLAEEHAHREFDKFDGERRHLEATRPTSDFDHAVEEARRLEKSRQKPPKPTTKPKGPRRKKPEDEAT